ncbi:putative RNA polymerase, Rpb5 [Rosa chinensis]|uniref:Putative RNA polymerase, Rpb5 n=1 Tax=Rosa chinensis TaxID=74649 RepID=A0A2P6SEG9_ROSCH|nr:putative RNA polymerase, Rpb5 [Rosa chinensis]
MVLTEEEIMRLYRVRKTVMQMLKDRDYLIVDHDLNMTMSQFKNKHGENMKREDLPINTRKRGDESDQVFDLGMNQENVIRAI